MITGLDHIGIAVQDLDAAVAIWELVTGHPCAHREIVAEQQVEVAVIRVGTLRLELVAPTSEDSPIARFIAGRGPGIHHIALRAENAQFELERTRAGGLPVIDRTPRKGAEDTLIGFLHPRALNGVLLEFVERSSEE